MPDYSVRVIPKNLDPPLDINWLADWLGITVEYRPLPEKVAGFYLKIGQYPHVVVNSADIPERQRWTLAHELGHHILGIASDKDVAFSLSTQDDKEQICDRFAAEILMPAQVVRRVADEVKHGLFDKTALLANMFEVSVTAMRIRLRELGLGWRK